MTIQQFVALVFGFLGMPVKWAVIEIAGPPVIGPPH